MRKLFKSSLVVSLVLLGGCGAKAERGVQDAPIDLSKTDNSAPKIINMPNGYPNVAFKCNGAVGVYASTRDYNSLTLMPNDPNCTNG